MKMSESPDEDANAPPLKKARYHWQVKNPRKCYQNGASDENGNCSQSTGNENFLEDGINSNQNHVDNLHLESEEETQTESKNNESTELKILDSVRKFVSGQTRQIVQSTIAQSSLETTDDFVTSNESVVSDPGEHNDQIAGPSHVTGALSSQSDADVTHITQDSTNFNRLEAYDEASSSTSVSNSSPRLDYVARWQSQQKAKAIVDNAINMTLEEMGLTPDLDHNLPILERLHVEDESISEAIRRRGLYPQDNQDDGDVVQGTITPLLHQLTQVSDRVFADRLNNMRLFITIRQTARNPEDGTETPLEWTDELAIRTLQSNSQEGVGENETVENPIPNQAFQLTLNSNHSPGVNESVVESSDNDFESDVENYYEPSETLNDSVLVESSSNILEVSNLEMSDINDVNIPENTENRVLENNCVETNQSDEHIEDSDLMNFAVNAAISAKGLAVQK